MTMQITSKSKQGRREAEKKKSKEEEEEEERLGELKKTNEAKYSGGLPTSYWINHHHYSKG